MKPKETLPIDGQRQQPLPPATCSAAGYWNQYPQDKPEEEGWYLVWHGGGPEASGYLAGFAQAYYTPKRDDWEAADPNSAIEDGCLVTHWAYVKPPNAGADAPAN